MRRTGQSRRQGQLHSPAATSAFSKTVAASEILMGQRESGNASRDRPERVMRPRDVPMRIHPLRSAGASLARGKRERRADGEQRP